MNKTRIAASILTFLVLGAPMLVAAQTKLENPLKFQTIQDFVAAAIKAVTYILLPVIVFFIVYAGYQFVSAGGDTGKISSARENIKYVIVGAAIILGAWALASIIAETINSLKG